MTPKACASPDSFPGPSYIWPSGVKGEDRPQAKGPVQTSNSDLKTSTWNTVKPLWGIPAAWMLQLRSKKCRELGGAVSLHTSLLPIKAWDKVQQATADNWHWVPLLTRKGKPKWVVSSANQFLGDCWSQSQHMNGNNWHIYCNYWIYIVTVIYSFIVGAPWWDRVWKMHGSNIHRHVILCCWLESIKCCQLQ